MRIGEFEITDHGNRFRMEYVGPKRYLTTASPNNNQWLKELLNKWYGRHEFVYKAPPLEFKQIPREKLDEMIRNSRLPNEILPLNYVGHIIFKKEEETAMEKDMKDYIGCYLKEVEFNPPYTTIFWSDDTSTQVKCVDEPYDPEKGFAMAVQKKLFGRNYYKNMESIIKRDGGYEKATQLVKLMDGKFFCYADTDSVRVDNAAEEIEKLKKENEYLKRSNELMYHNNRGLIKDLMNVRYDNRIQDDINETLKSANSSYKKVINDLNKRIDDLKKAKENMAKKLAETKQLKKDLDAQMLKNGELDRENQKLRRDAEIKSNLIDRQREDIHRLKEWFRREAEKVSNLQRRNDTQAESIHTLMNENKTLKISIKQIEQIKEILK